MSTARAAFLLVQVAMVATAAMQDGAADAALGADRSVSKHMAPFLFKWEKGQSPIQGALWCEASRGEIFNLGQCTEQAAWADKKCVLKPFKPNVATYPAGGWIDGMMNWGGWLVDATTTYEFEDDLKHADGELQVAPSVLGEWGTFLYARVTISDSDPLVLHQRWTKKKGDTEGEAVIDGNYYLVLDQHGTPTKYWNQMIGFDKVESYNVDASFYNERMTELASELGVPEDQVWTTIWSMHGIDPDTGLRNSLAATATMPGAGKSVKKHMAPFLFKWEKDQSPIQGALWCEASRGEIFNLGQCTEQATWADKKCALKPFQPNVATYPDGGWIDGAMNWGGWLLDATTTYQFEDDLKHADGELQVAPSVLGEWGTFLYARVTISDSDPLVLHQRWTKKKGDTEGKAVIDGNYYLVLDQHGTPTKYWNQMIGFDKVESYNVDASFYNERMTELASELGVPEDQVWTTIWSVNGIDPDTGLIEQSSSSTFVV